MRDYQKGKIYTIRCRNDDTMIYIGSTIQTLAVRWGSHKRDSKKEKNKNRLIYTTINNDWENWYIELHSLYPCNSKEELDKEEGKIIREIGNLNMVIAGRTKKEYRDENKDKESEYNKKYYEENKDKESERHKEYRENNKDKLKEKSKKYYEENKDKVKEKQRKKYQDNKQIITCICGCISNNIHLKLHLKSKKHTKLMALQALHQPVLVLGAQQVVQQVLPSSL